MGTSLSTPSRPKSCWLLLRLVEVLNFVILEDKGFESFSFLVFSYLINWNIFKGNPRSLCRPFRTTRRKNTCSTAKSFGPGMAPLILLNCIIFTLWLIIFYSFNVIFKCQIHNRRTLIRLVPRWEISTMVANEGEAGHENSLTNRSHKKKEILSCHRQTTQKKETQGKKPRHFYAETVS